MDGSFDQRMGENSTVNVVGFVMLLFHFLLFLIPWIEVFASTGLGRRQNFSTLIQEKEVNLNFSSGYFD